MVGGAGQSSSYARPRARSNANNPVRLADAVRQLMEDQISPRQTKFELVAGLWSHLLPAELQRHCELVAISGGQLKVAVDSAAHMHELRLCSSWLLEEMEQYCPRAQIKKIKLVIGRVASPEP